jgi:D-amino-acid dehydrogenase
LRFLAASNLQRIDKIADALRALLGQTFDAYQPIAQHASASDLIRRTGYVVTYDKREAFLGDSIAWKLRRDRGVIVEEIDDAGIKSLVPQLTGQYEVGLYLPEQGFVANPERLTKTLAVQFQRDGGVFLQSEVRDIEIGSRGPRALLTASGRVPVETLIVCAGSHSNMFTSKLGDRVPLEAERGYHVTYSDPRYTLPMPVFMPEHKFFITPMEMGLRIAGQSEFAGIDAEPNHARADILSKHMQRVFPDLSAVDSTQWMGRRPSMPDSLPVISRSTKFADVYYAFGHGHVGLCGAAPTGRLIADLVAGREPNIDVTPYRVDRF